MNKNNLKVGMKFRTNNTPRECYHVITEVSNMFTVYETVYPNGMRPFTSSPTDSIVRWFNTPHTGLEFLS